MDKVTVMRAARSLVRRRLLRRLPNRADGRSHRLMLTAAGERVYQDIVPLALEHESQLLHHIGRQETEQLHRWLRQLEGSAQSALNSFNHPHSRD